jgi:HipA-like protein
MRNRRAFWAESLGDILASWGLTPRAASSRAQQARVQVWGPVHDAERVFIGELTNDVGEYVFRYDAAYAARPDYPALAAFPDKLREYRSPALWPFFDVRLPPLDRADIQRLIQERKIDQGDTLRLLAELGRRTVTTPYELQYGAAASR